MLETRILHFITARRYGSECMLWPFVRLCVCQMSVLYQNG